MKNSILTAAGFCLLLSGCGGGGGSLTAAGGSVNLAQATKIFTANQVSTALGSLVPSANTNSPVSLPTNFVASNPFAACTQENPLNEVDDDGDNIPLLKEFKYNCNGVASGKSILKRVGYYKIVDFNDAPGIENKGWGGGYRFEFDFSNSMDASHEMFNDIYNGFFEVKKTASSLGYSSEYTGTVQGMNKTPVQFEWNWKWQSKWDNVYTPEDMAKPYDKGSAKFNGFFGVTGSIPGNNNELVEVKVVFELKSKGLKYDNSCNYHWSEGSISYVDGSKNEVRYEYACSSVKVYFNGKEETLTLTRMN